MATERKAVGVVVSGQAKVGVDDRGMHVKSRGRYMGETCRKYPSSLTPPLATTPW